MDIYAADSDDSNEKAEDTSVLRWVSTTVAEVYVFLAVLIYMGNHPENRMEDHWIDDTKVDAGFDTPNLE
ncbi:hypothetical protein E4U19_003020, partial [Claviceps sp. Clav32 group G5]